jgi:cytochrome c oxidase assembly factor CtaG
MMATSFDAVLSSWTAAPWLAVSLVCSAAVYLRGFLTLRGRELACEDFLALSVQADAERSTGGASGTQSESAGGGSRWSWWRFAAFAGALATLYVALASPIEAFSSLLLQVHTLQHLLLTMVIPPLVWLSAPMLPMLFGLPGEVRRYWAAPLVRSSRLRTIMAKLTHPIGALVVFVGITWLWHFPALYQLALDNQAWHVVQHVCFLAAGLLFWYPVLRPFPARPAWPAWLLVPLLLLADVQNTVFAALLTFSDHVWYPHYDAMPRIGGLTALDDQSAAGVLMWVPGSVVFLAPLAWIGLGLLKVRSVECGVWNPAFSRARWRRDPLASNQYSVLSTKSSVLGTRRWDLLRAPLIGSALRWRHTRTIVQVVVLLVVVAVIVDGLFGTRVGPMNLAGVVPWIHWRGLVIFGLLVAGNVFCYGCPFMLPRTIARRVFPALGKRAWPRWLRTKWIAVGLMVAFLWAYETFALWDSPWLTAWIAIAYLVGALVIDGLFRDAAFCKYVCPIGQFNFVQSIVSPLEVRVREPAVCTSCKTHECIRGTASSPLAQVAPSDALLGAPFGRPQPHPAVNASLPILSGCEMKLFQPRKSGNLDCTFCLDCVQACPHDNVGVLVTAPMKTLWHDGVRSGVGRLGRRMDYAVLGAVLVFGAFANAAGMVRPVVDAERQFAEAVQLSSLVMPNTTFYAFALLALPAAMIGLASFASYSLVPKTSLRNIACRFTWSLVPLGFAIWLAHYSFHFFTSCESIVPATQRFAADFQLTSLGAPNWVCSCCQAAPAWLLNTEIVALDIGLLASLYAAWRIALQFAGGMDRRAFRVWLPWAVLAVALFALGVWILLQPMEMRGTLPS